MARTSYFTLTLALAALTGCDTASQAVAPDAPDAALAVAGGGHAVIGSGHVQGAAGLREFTFHAKETSDGGAQGSFKVVLANGLFFVADVTCLAVDGDTGWVAGIIRETNAGVVVVGAGSMFWARDGGEGEDATDVVSTAAINAPAGADVAFCAERPLALPPMTVTDGNVQVR